MRRPLRHPVRKSAKIGRRIGKCSRVRRQSSSSSHLLLSPPPSSYYLPPFFFLIFLLITKRVAGCCCCCCRHHRCSGGRRRRRRTPHTTQQSFLRRWGRGGREECVNEVGVGGDGWRWVRGGRGARNEVTVRVGGWVQAAERERELLAERVCLSSMVSVWQVSCRTRSLRKILFFLLQLQVLEKKKR